MSARPARPHRRGSVSLEYVFLASLLGGGLVLSLAFPDTLGDLLLGAGANMDRGVVADGLGDGEVSPPTYTGGGEDDDEEFTADPSTGGGGEDPDWSDDPWEGEDPGEPAVTPGAVVTILLTMSDPNIPPWLAATLADNVVQHVSQVPAPRILVVRDDNHNGEDIEDTPYISGIMRGMMGLSTNEVTYLDEPAAGLTYADVQDYDVVWFANPGYPMDDPGTIHALQQAVEAGIGVVFQGDDMSWTAGHAYDDELAALTGLDHESNGTSACGQAIDNNHGGQYRVTFGSDSPILAGLEGVTVLYGNDIDHASASGDVYATATPDGSGCGLEIPVLVASY